jgi:hypothetical protein
VTTRAQYRAMGAAQPLAGGEWVTGRGGVQRWQPHTAAGWRVRARMLMNSEKLPQRNDWPDMHELRACTSCPARVDEPCVQPNGARAKMPHVGRLTPRLCRCGELPRHNARKCDACLRPQVAVA